MVTHLLEIVTMSRTPIDNIPYINLDKGLCLTIYWNWLENGLLRMHFMYCIVGFFEVLICDWAHENQPSEHKKLPIFCFCFIIATTKSSSLPQNLMGFLLQLTELGYYVLNENINENITRCNLYSYGRYLHAQSHISWILWMLMVHEI